MKKLISFALVLVLLVSVLTLTSCSGNLEEGTGFNVNSLAKRNLLRGEYMATALYDDFFDAEYEYAHRNLPQLENESDWSDCWRYTGLVSMMLRLNELTDNNYDSEMKSIFSAFDYYRGVRSDNTVGPNGTGREFTVFAVNRSTRGKFKANALGTLSVFDDQIWIAREYYNAYMLYGDKTYLDTAIELAEYIYLVGFMPNVGGITWGQDYDTRHSCSNAPFVKVLLDLYKATNREEFKTWATNVYDFMYNTLRDPSDNLYYDLVGTIFDENGTPIANDSFDKTKYTYNSGAMISAGVAMYNVTNDKTYLEHAKATAESCRNYFGFHDFKEGYVMYPTATTTWFNLVMYIGYYDLFLADNTQTIYLDDVQKAIDYAYENFGRDGYIPVSWLVGWEDGWQKSDCKNLLDHTSHAETYLLLAQYQQAKEDLLNK